MCNNAGKVDGICGRQRSTSSPFLTGDDEFLAIYSLVLGNPCFCFCLRGGALHFKYSALADMVDVDLFKKLALLCDKYDCVAPLRFVSEQWLLQKEKTVKKDELATLLFIIYVLDRPEQFSHISMRIVREFSGSLKHLKTLGAFEITPPELLSTF